MPVLYAFPILEPMTIDAIAREAIDALPAGATTEQIDAAYLPARRAAAGGMTLRDYFAAKAMAAILSNPNESFCEAIALDEDDEDDEDNVYAWAYWIADRMLQARDA